MKFLATINETFEIEMLRELLEANDIILSTKHRETGEFMVITTGMTMFGTDLYVEESLYDSAMELYTAFFSGNAVIDEEAFIEEALNAPNPEEMDEDESNEITDEETEEEIEEDDDL